jgi:hypothetical protein
VLHFGAYPADFLSRARALLGINGEDRVLQVCAGKVKEYPCDGFGPRDLTMDLDPDLGPDIRSDASNLVDYKRALELHPVTAARQTHS